MPHASNKALAHENAKAVFDLIGWRLRECKAVTDESLNLSSGFPERAEFEDYRRGRVKIVDTVA
jgi:hypothetical protein